MDARQLAHTSRTSVYIHVLFIQFQVRQTSYLPDKHVLYTSRFLLNFTFPNHIRIDAPQFNSQYLSSIQTSKTKIAPVCLGLNQKSTDKIKGLPAARSKVTFDFPIRSPSEGLTLPLDFSQWISERKAWELLWRSSIHRFCLPPFKPPTFVICNVRQKVPFVIFYWESSSLIPSTKWLQSWRKHTLYKFVHSPLVSNEYVYYLDTYMYCRASSQVCVPKWRCPPHPPPAYRRSAAVAQDTGHRGWDTDTTQHCGTGTPLDTHAKSKER